MDRQNSPQKFTEPQKQTTLYPQKGWRDREGAYRENIPNVVVIGIEKHNIYAL